ncbi:MAG: hypothetical protein AB3N13_16810 [Arenibacterium sp.]
MREFVLAFAMVAAIVGQVQAMPAEVPSTYPKEGIFCGFMELCTPKAVAPRPNVTQVEDNDAQPPSQ